MDGVGILDQEIDGRGGGERDRECDDAASILADTAAKTLIEIGQQVEIFKATIDDSGQIVMSSNDVSPGQRCPGVDSAPVILSEDMEAYNLTLVPQDDAENGEMLNFAVVYVGESEQGGMMNQGDCIANDIVISGGGLVDDDDDDLGDISSVLNNVLGQAALDPTGSAVDTLSSNKESKNKQKLPCTVCTKTFSGQASLRHHVRTIHSEERGPHPCDQCDRSFWRSFDLKLHKNQHLEHRKRPFICDMCGKSFLAKQHLLDHRELHTDGLPFVCSYCDVGFKTSLYLKRHVRKHHEQPDQIIMYQCHICDSVFKMKCTLKEHLDTHQGEWLCEDCGKSYSTNKRLQTHKKSVHERRDEDDGTKKYPCEMCSKSYWHRSSLNAHLKLHASKPQYQCQHCDKSFWWRECLRDHMVTHTGQRKWQCDVCGKRFITNGHLTAHYRTHTDDRPFTCWCGKSFRLRATMRTHWKTHNVSEAEGWELMKEFQQKMEQSTSQDDCKMIQSEEVLYDDVETVIQLGQHLEGLDMPTHPPNIQQHQMPVPDSQHTLEENEIFQFALEMVKRSERNINNSHDDGGQLETVGDPAAEGNEIDIVEDCQLINNNTTEVESVEIREELMEVETSELTSYDNNSADHDVKVQPSSELEAEREDAISVDALIEEMVDCETVTDDIDNSVKPNTYRCDQCSKVFARKASLSGHVKRHHTNSEPEYKCSDCDKSFWTTRGLRVHKQIHNEVRVRPHVCDKCGKSFLARAHLQDHYLTHTDCSFYCKECECVFKTLKYLKRHERKHHGDQERHKCNLCGALFTEKSSLKDHIDSHVGMWKCDLCEKTYSTRKSLTHHNKTFHDTSVKKDGTKYYQCDICEKSYWHRTSLNAHRKLHASQAEYQCQVCGKQFWWRECLRDHMLSHTGQRKWQCDVCGKKFTTNGHLTAHYRTHTDERPFTCWCGKSFRLRAAMRSHWKTHRVTEDEGWVMLNASVINNQ